MHDQDVAWNGPAGRAWAEHAESYDSTLEPFGEAVLARLDLQRGQRVVDVGCGAGATTVAIAERVSPGLAVGVDISEPMLAAARGRAERLDVSNVAFRRFDVESDAFDRASFDVAFSRFGVMFFVDPVTAFANIRAALTDDGRLGFVCFQELSVNPMIVVPVMAAAAHVEMLPLPGPTDPSPFSLADPDRIREVLTDAGFGQVVVEAGPDRCDLGAADDIEAVAVRSIEQNPGISPGFERASDDARSAAVAATVDALSSHVVDGRVVLAAGTWVVTALCGQGTATVVA